MEICKKLTKVVPEGPFFLLRTNCADIRLIFLTDEIVRLRVSFDRPLEEGSYILSTTAWPDRLDSLLQRERTRVLPVSPAWHESDTQVVFSTASLRLVWDRDPLSFVLYDADGAELYRALPGSPFLRDGNRRVTHYSCMREDDCFYGFGEKGGPLNKNGEFIRERATDALGYDPLKTDTLYKHIPFLLRLDRQTKKAVGLFYHNFYESVFNLGRERSNYRPRYFTWQADGGEIDLFLFGGGSLKRILDHYTYLTGRPVLLPKRALGYQGSSMYYAEQPERCDEAILSFVDTAREEGFPLDGFYLSSGYTSREGRRCVFTWNAERFPDPPSFFSAMQEKGAPCVPNVKPGFLLTHPLVPDLSRQGVFLKDSEDPSQDAVGPWWGGPGVFWDFTSAKARRLWKDLLIRSLIRFGTASVWNDNCEYDSLLDQDARADYDGEGGTVGQLKPLMSTLMCKAAMEAVAEHDPDARPYIVCRSGSAGIQKYAQTWCGDNATSWETLRYNIPTILGMGLSGQPNEGADIGGFAGPAPGEELLVRWVQNGIFQPRFCIHSASSDNTVTEPWMFSSSTGIIREAILFRYRLIPYLYSLMRHATLTGAPIMRALVFEFQEDPRVWDESFEFLLGRDLLVAGVLSPGVSTREVYLPAGSRWYDWNDAFRCYEGGQAIKVPVTLSTIPMFLREGAILPMADNQPMNLERDPVTALHLLIAPEDDRSFTLYDDDGVSNAWETGAYRKTQIRVRGGETVEIFFTSEGAYEDTVKTVFLEVLRKDRSPCAVSLGDKRLPHFLSRSRFDAAACGWYYSQTKRCVQIRYPNPRKDIRLALFFEPQDLISM